MAYIIGDGFDFYSNVTDCAQNYWSGVTTTNVATALSTTTPFSTGQSLAIQPNAIPSTTTAFLSLFSFSNATTLFFTANVSTNDGLVATSNLTSWQWLDSTTTQCSIDFMQTGAISLVNNTGTTLASLSAAFVTGEWTNVQAKVVIDSATGSFSLRINGSSTDNLSITGINTQHTTNGFSNGFRIVSKALGGVGSGHFFYVDDLLLYSGQGAAPNTFTGNIRALQLMPNADVTTQFTPLSGSTNFSQVDELHEDGDTSYVFSSTVGQSDLYSIASLPFAPNSITGVNLRIFARKTDAGARDGSGQIKSGVTTVTTATVALAQTYENLNTFFATDPATGAAWAPSAVNAMEIGPVVTG